MFICSVYCHPWDLLDETIDTVLDTLQGRIGAGSLTLLVVCDEAREIFRPHARAQPRVLSSTGGVYFAPDAQRYSSSRLAPPLASETRRRNLLALAGEQCSARGLDLRAAVKPWRSVRLASRHPECAKKDLCGHASLGALCPYNPDVRAYLLGLAGDLSADDNLGAIVLDLADLTPGAGPSFVPPSCDRAAALLLDLCFCESCLQQAAGSNVDGEAALRTAGQRLEQSCAQGPGALRTEEGPPLQRYRAWTHTRLCELLRDFRRAAGKPVVLHDPGLVLADTPLEGLADQVLVDAGQASRRHDLSVPPEFAWRFDESPPQEAAALIQQAAGAANLGVTSLTMIHYGAICEWQFDWIRQAVRHGRRLQAG
jgi:hypothetical protein